MAKIYLLPTLDRFRTKTILLSIVRLFPLRHLGLMFLAPGADLCRHSPGSGEAGQEGAVLIPEGTVDLFPAITFVQVWQRHQTRELPAGSRIPGCPRVWRGTILHSSFFSKPGKNFAWNTGGPLTINTDSFGGQSMTGRLLRVMVCPPRNAGWDRREKRAGWRELGFLYPPEFEPAQMQHEILCKLLTEAEVEVLYLRGADELTLDAVYVHDASFSTNAGMILMNPGKRNRVPEAGAHAAFFSSCGLPILGRVVVPGVSEAGDMVWLDEGTLLVGRGYRTNAAGLEQLRDLFRPAGVKVLDAPLPHGRGPSTCLHLMSLMSKLDERTMLVDLPWLAVETVELLTSRGFELIEIDPSERDTLASNVLSLGGKRLIAVAENVRTNAKLRNAGFDVRTFPGSELSINGGGGPTCLTRPLLRESAKG